MLFLSQIFIERASTIERVDDGMGSIVKMVLQMRKRKGFFRFGKENRSVTQSGNGVVPVIWTRTLTYTHLSHLSTNHLGPDAVFDSFSFGVNSYCQREFV